MARFCVSPKRVSLAVAVALATCSVALAEPEAQPAKPVAASPAQHASQTHYIEFRVAQIGTYGHSYVAYGRLNARGQPADFHYADLHPTGNYALMAVGHVLPVPANTKWDPEVLKLPVASSYRRKITAAQYKNLVAAVARSRQGGPRYWNALLNNCNHYVADLAIAVGLRAPKDLRVSYAFVPALRALNEAGNPQDSGPARAAATGGQRTR